MPQADYQGGSIVNLMASLTLGLGGAPHGYAPLRVLKPERLQRYRTVVLLVIDGLGYHALTHAEAGNTLRRYLQGRITSVFPATTASAITSFLTGLAPQQHGLTGWHTWFRELGCVLTALQTRPRYGGCTLSEAGIDAARLFGHVPVFDRLPVRSFVIAPKYIAHSDFNLAHRGRAELRVYQTLEQMFELTARTACTAKERSYVYAYWPDLDRIAHEHGIASAMANAHLAELDAGFERFLNRIAASDTLVIVTADHGIIDSAEEYVIDIEHHPALADMLRLPLCGERRVAYCYVQPDRCRDFEHYVHDKLAPYTELWPSRELIARDYFGLNAPHPRLHERVGDYTLIMKDNFVIKDQLFGERPFSQLGVHGGQSEQELYVPLIVAP
jgi:hypothetical protein